MHMLSAIAYIRARGNLYNITQIIMQVSACCKTYTVAYNNTFLMGHSLEWNNKHFNNHTAFGDQEERKQQPVYYTISCDGCAGRNSIHKLLRGVGQEPIT